MSSSIREYIRENLLGGIPEGDVWTIDPGIPTLSRLDRPILWIEYTSFAPEPTAPRSHIAAGVDVCIATSKTDLRTGEDEADEMVAALFEHMFGSGAFLGISANKTMFAEKYIGWRISVTVPTTNPTEE